MYTVAGSLTSSRELHFFSRLKTRKHVPFLKILPRCREWQHETFITSVEKHFGILGVMIFPHVQACSGRCPRGHGVPPLLGTDYLCMLLLTY